MTTSTSLSASGQQSEELGRYALIQHSILTFQCLCGMALNVGILVLFFLMKQVRGSVYAAYMIQIAITDVLVCLTWLTFSSWIISHVRNVDRGFHQLQENETTSSGGYEEFSYSDSTLDVITLIYNFHFYINIFLLAAMSVERFVAVWKSLRCQRYQFNKKFTYAVSATMWFMAFLCILPNIVDRELGTGISSNIKSIPANLTVDDLMNDPFLRDQSEEWATLLDCIKPYTDAVQYKNAHPEVVEVYVESVDGVSVTNCSIFMQKLLQDIVITSGSDILNNMDIDNNTKTETLRIDDNSDSIEPFDYGEGNKERRHSLIIYRQARNSDEPKMMPVVDMTEYYFAIYFAFEHLKSKSLREPPNNNLCVPPYTSQAKIYNIAVNVTVGFFLPYMAIVCSYLGIACMIRKRAQQRLDNQQGAVDVNNHHTSITDLGRRMSVFIRSIAGGGGHSQTTVVHHAPTPTTLTQQQNIDGNKTDEIPAIKVDNSPNIIHHQQHITIEESEEKLRHNSTITVSSAQLRRISGGSTASSSGAESFLTDHTSLQLQPTSTANNPGVRLSQPLFIHDKIQQKQMRRAVSADSGTASFNDGNNVAGNQQQLNYHQVRHHSNTADQQLMFRSTMCDADTFNKKDSILIAETPETISETKPFHPPHYRITANDANVDKSTAPSSGGGLIVSSKVKPSSSKHENMGGDGKKDRGRISQVSRSSTGTAPYTGKTTAHRNAERHMKIARTVTAYVIVFSLCWLPQRIQLVVYTMEGMKDVRETTCHTISIVLRIISFFSVLLNPIVYATTQRDIRTYIRRIASRVRKRCQNSKLNKCIKTTTTITNTKVSIKTKATNHNCDGLPASTVQAVHQIKNNSKTTTITVTATKENSKFPPHNRNNKHLERRIWLANRIGRANQQHDDTLHRHGGGTIDEEVTPLAPRTANQLAPSAAFLKQDWLEPGRPTTTATTDVGSTDFEKLNESVM